LFFNFLGGISWAIGMTLLGYYLGSVLGHVEGIDRYFTLLVLAFFFIPGLPTLFHVWKDNREKILGWVNARLGRNS
jgi:membrane-associated protein